jgi:peptidoglycan/LPS O-acetylase OafA/YrhL
LARIYPSYLVLLLIACVVPHVPVYRGLDAGILSVTLTQAWVPLDKFAFGLNGVSWSLSCEAFFYALFPLLLVWMTKLGRRRLVGLALGTYVLGAITVVAGVCYGPGGRRSRSSTRSSGFQNSRSGWRPAWRSRRDGGPTSTFAYRSRSSCCSVLSLVCFICPNP